MITISGPVVTWFLVSVLAVSLAAAIFLGVRAARGKGRVLPAALLTAAALFTWLLLWTL